MAKKRLWVVALSTFLLITCGSFLKKAIALSLCGLLSFETFTCNATIFRETEAIATPNPTLITQDIFQNNNSDSPPQPAIDIFQRERDNIQIQSNALWLYSIYLSLEEVAFYNEVIRVSYDENEFTISDCDANCFQRELYVSDRSNQLQDYAHLEMYNNLLIEYSTTIDNKAILGLFQDLESNETIYFTLEELSFDDFLSRKYLLDQRSIESTNSSLLSQIQPTNPSSRPPSYPNIPSNNPSSDLQRLNQNVSSTSNRVQPVSPTSSTDLNMASQRLRSQPRILVRISEWLRSIGRIGRSTLIFLLAELLIIRADPATTATLYDSVAHCGEQQVSGGQLGDRRRIELTASRGTVLISYEMFDVPDRLEVIYENQRILDTGFVSGSNSLTVSIDGSLTWLIVRVEGNPDVDTTEWNYTLICPQSN